MNLQVCLFLILLTITNPYIFKITDYSKRVIYHNGKKNVLCAFKKKKSTTAVFLIYKSLVIDLLLSNLNKTSK